MSQSTLREALLTRLGPFPERVPLDLVYNTPFAEDTFSRTLVTYRVEGGERVPAWLLVPSGEPPPEGWPAVLAIHPHGGQFDIGKSELVGLVGDSTLAYGAKLCRQGYVVLCPDLLCFEDRRPVTGTPWERLQGREYERFEFTRRLLYGSCLQAKHLHDLVCALDVVCSLSHVNPQRIGVIGYSLGGMQAVWLSWYDERVAATVSACGISMFQAMIRDGINHCHSIYVPGMLKVHDMHMIVAALAPRPFMLAAAENDHIFPADGVRMIIALARREYARQDATDQFQIYLFPGEHSFPIRVQQEAFAFLDYWLKESR